MNDKCFLPLQQTRRKLEDVGKKLEILYDKLREHVVSEEEEDGFGMASLELLELGNGVGRIRNTVPLGFYDTE